jgi:hypothetical protein
MDLCGIMLYVRSGLSQPREMNLSTDREPDDLGRPRVRVIFGSLLDVNYQPHDFGMEDIIILLEIAPSKLIFTRAKGLCNQGMTCCILRWQHARVNFVLAFTSQICILHLFLFLSFFSFIFVLSIFLIMFNTFQPLNRLSRGEVNRLGARVWSLRVSRV